MKKKTDYLEVVKRFQEEQRRFEKMTPCQQMAVLDDVLRSWTIPQISANEAAERFNQQ